MIDYEIFIIDNKSIILYFTRTAIYKTMACLK